MGPGHSGAAFGGRAAAEGYYQVLQLLLTVDSPHVARAWLIGMNPQLDDEAPADVIREGRLREALVAAQAFVSGADSASGRGGRPGVVLLATSASSPGRWRLGCAPRFRKWLGLRASPLAGRRAGAGPEPEVAGREGGGAVSGAEDRLRLDRPEAATTPVHRSQRGRS